MVAAEKVDGIKRMSSTALGHYSTCKAQFYFLDILKIRRPKNQSLFFGIVFDEALNFNYAHKRVADQDLPRDDIKDFFRTKWESEKEQVLDWEEEDPAKLRETGIEGVNIFYNEVIPAVRPEEVQPNLEMTFTDSEVVLRGRPDLIEKSREIVDNKTTGASRPETFIKQSSQPVLYSLFKDKLDPTPREVRYDILVKTKKPKVQRLKTVITQEYRAAELQYVGQVIEDINSMLARKNFPPDAFHRGSWECGYCPASDVCRKTFKLPIPESKRTMIPTTDAITKTNNAIVEKAIDENKFKPKIMRNIII